MQDNKNQLKDLGIYFKNLRKAKKLSLSSVAYRSQIDPSTLSRIEKGLIEPKYFTLKGLINALEVNANEIFKDMS